MKYLFYASLFLNFLFTGKYVIRFLFKSNIAADKPPTRNPYFAERYKMIQKLQTDSSSIVFIGDSHTNNFEFREHFNNCHIQNRGVGGDSSKDILLRLQPILAGKPRKLFVQMGANDPLHLSYGVDSLMIHYKELIRRTQEESPHTEIIVQALVPMKKVEMQLGVVKANKLLSKYCYDNQIRFVDIAAHFPDDYLVADEAHLTYAAYIAWMNQIAPYL